MIINTHRKVGRRLADEWINKMNKRQEAIKHIKEFEAMKDMSELKALSNHSLEQPLTTKQYNRVMELKKKVFKEE